MSKTFESDIFGKGQAEDYDEETRPDRASLNMDNRKFDGRYDIKITMGPLYFAEFMRFMKDINYDILMIFQKEKIKFYTIHSSKSLGALISLDNVEVADYEIKTDQEIRCLLGIEFVDKITLNEQYAVDMYIDLRDNKVSVINGKEISWTRLASTKNENILLSSFEGVESRINEWTDINSASKLTKIVLGSTLRGVLQSLDKKRPDKKSKMKVDVEFKKNEIDFTVSNQNGGSSIQMYGEDIVESNLKETIINTYSLEYLAKFGKFKQFFNNINLYVKTDHPLVMETTMGSGGIVIQYFVAPHLATEEKSEPSVAEKVSKEIEEMSIETPEETDNFTIPDELEESDLQET